MNTLKRIAWISPLSLIIAIGGLMGCSSGTDDMGNGSDPASAGGGAGRPSTSAGTSGSVGIAGSNGQAGSVNVTPTSGTLGRSGGGGAAGASGRRGSGVGGAQAVSGASGAVAGSSATAGRSGSAGRSGTTGSSGAAGRSGTVASSGNAGSSGVGGSTGVPPTETEKFSFFVTSLAAMRRLSKNENGFGGDLRYGETGTGAGLRGADKICTEIAEGVMPGSGAKIWRAFLSASAGENGSPVNAIDRIGSGPWYDRLGRVVATSLTDLATARPTGADPAIVNDFPNEEGVPNHRPDPSQPAVDNHDALTGSNAQGKLQGAGATCNDWTSALGTEGKPQIGHAWPRNVGGGRAGGGGGDAWMSAHTAPGCKAGINLVQDGAGDTSNPTVGASGGYGSIYCFALSP